LHADATCGDDRRSEGGVGGEKSGVSDLVLARRGDEPGEPAEQGERMEDDLLLPAPEGAPELESNTLLVEPLELSFCEGRSRDVADELLPADLVAGSYSHLRVHLEGWLAPLLARHQRDDPGWGLRCGEPPGVVVLRLFGVVLEVSVAAEPAHEAEQDALFEGLDVGGPWAGVLDEVEAFGLDVRAVQDEHVEVRLRRHGYLDDEAKEPKDDDAWWLGAAHAHSGVITVAGDKKRRKPAFEVHAKVRVRQGDRVGRQQLVRYVTRAPFAEDQIEVLDEERVRFELRSPLRGGQQLLDDNYPSPLTTTTPPHR
jgi:hypothetical protein